MLDNAVKKIKSLNIRLTGWYCIIRMI